MEDLKEKLQAVYKLKATIIGEGKADRKEGTYLGRTFRWQEWGLELEGNEKHVQELLRCTGMETCKPVNSPMTAEGGRGRGEERGIEGEGEGDRGREREREGEGEERKRESERERGTHSFMG